MHITCLFNPRSGRGKGLAGARELESRLIERGHRVAVLEMTENPHSLCSQIQSSDRVVVIGGDGTVHHLLPTLLKAQMNAQVPIYHFGTGTANLIAKEFGMSKSPKRIVEHLEQPIEPTRADVPTCNGLAFLIMVSIGIDASVIHRFAAARATKKAGYRAYFQPIVHELFSPNPARFSISPDDQTSDFTPIHTTGIGVISNLRSYGGGFNPNPKANPCDGMLNATAIQCKGSLGAGVQLGLLRVRYTSSKIKRASAMSMNITCDAPCPVQVDGERADRIPGITDGSLCPGQSLQIVIGNDSLLFHATKPRPTSRVR